MSKTIRIGNAGGYWGDDLSAMRRQLEGGDLDYITQDFLAEITMSILQRQRQKKPELGYATDFVTQIEDCLPLIVAKNVKIISNAGGINPLGLGEKIIEIAKDQGHAIKVGIVSGDDILDDIDTLMAKGETFDNMETGEKFTDVRDRVTSANVYLGAEGVVAALKAGCQIVVTGRVTDTGVTLAPMIHEFGWAADDWDKLAAGVLAGHIIECGAQSTGGNITDWDEVPTFRDIGYPIIEMADNGEFVVTKHDNTGGLVSEKSVKEQLVYEMGDPANYISPDAIARFDTVQLEQDGDNRVKVWGIKGAPAPKTLKISMSHEDGWKASGMLLVCGPNVREKAKAIADAFWHKLGTTFEHAVTDLVGTGAIWPSPLSNYEPTEIYLRFSVRDHDRSKCEHFGKQLPTMILAGPSGMAVTGSGRPRPQQVVAYWPTLIERARVKTKVTIIGTDMNRLALDVAVDRDLPDMARLEPLSKKQPSKAYDTTNVTRVLLRELAYARSGDKGDTCNIGLLARSEMIYDWLKGYLTESRVKEFFTGINKGDVTRYELDNLWALNFLLDETLGGGGTRSLMVDPQGKTLAQALLQMTVEVPSDVLNSLKK